MEGTSVPARIAFFTVACILLFAGLSDACVTISKVCPNPDNAKNEWLELRSACAGDENLSGFLVGDPVKNYSLDGKLPAGSFAVVANNATLFTSNYSGLPCMIADLGVNAAWMNNGGDNITLYAQGQPHDSLSYNTTAKGECWIRCGDAWQKTANATPGADNACQQEEPPPPPVNAPNVSITSWSVNATSAMDGASILVTITAGNTGNASANASAYIYATGFPPSACGAVELGPQEEETVSCTWKVPDAGDDVTSISLSPGLSGDGWSAGGSAILLSIIRDCSMEVSLSAEPIEASVRFGERTFVKAAVCMECGRTPLRLAAYLYSPHWASVDTNGDTIRTRPNETSSAIVIEDVTDGCRNIYIPVSIAPDCERDFGEGLYGGKARIYEDVTGKVLDEQNFNMTISGRNKALCVECDECRKCECSSKKTSCTGGATVGSGDQGGTPSNAAVKKNYKHFDVDSAPSSVHAGEAFSANITIKNTLPARTGFTAYSYAYNASTCVSLGQAPAGWMKGWDSNRKTVTLDSGGRAEVELRNLIPDDVPPGIYTFRIRVRYGDADNDKEDATFPLEVKEVETGPALNETDNAPDKPEDSVNSENMTTSAVNKTRPGIPVTGMASAREGGNKSVFSYFYEGFVSLLSLFKI